MTNQTHGCCIEVDNDGYGEVFDFCVLETSSPNDCVEAKGLERKEDCPFWRDTKEMKGTYTNVVGLQLEIKRLTKATERTPLEKAAPKIWAMFCKKCNDRAWSCDLDVCTHNHAPTPYRKCSPEICPFVQNCEIQKDQNS